MTPHWFTRPLAAGDVGPDVAVVQRKLGAVPDGVFTSGLAAVVRGFQATRGRSATGQVDEDTAAALGEEAGYGRIPDWYGTDQGPGVVADLLGVTSPDDVRDAVKRFQGNSGLPVTGVVDELTARKLGDKAEGT
ncbi:hypothetical protein DDP54_15475 (plasmid) [Cellulomonas sp. WB94]|uniref:peptidoglycan-binding domain-containing protein n=1 Tax=Cellulomonas sp. WB94 TaxID=2173174 RepID=UPI000D5700FC|nr:peptidoglycan-binding protein [Cellulomonas sp. WB94]PVU81533.1 hypothetical protein DDP54_15475 [Cellulomonas sp. WB94]